jgi:ligand-binding sensor domain-containing protein
MMRLSRTPVQVLALPGAADSDFGTVSLDADGSIWTASNQLVHVKGGFAVPERISGVGDARVRNLLRSRDGSLWIGTDGSGVYHLAAQHNTHYTTREGLVNNFVRGFLESSDGSVWIGTDNGLSHLAARGFQNFTVENGLAYDSIRALLEDRDGVIWIGTEHGVSGWKNGSFIHNELTAALEDEKIWALHQDSGGGLWFGTRTHGLYRYRSGSLTHFTTANGLASDSIYCILEDARGHFWISGPSGVTLLRRGELDAQASNHGQTLSMSIFRATEGGKSTQFYGGTAPSGALAAPARRGSLQTKGSGAFGPKEWSTRLYRI